MSSSLDSLDSLEEREEPEAAVLDSIFMFTGLLGGHAAYTWADWARALAWSGFGNLIGGTVLVTSIRLLQVPHRVAEERADH